MTNADVDRLLRRLDTTTADQLEDETLEFKRRPRNREQLKHWAVEAAVCFANQRGGTIIFGVRDRTIGRAEAVECVDLSIARLRREIYDATDPSILVDVHEVDVPEGRLIVMRVPQGLPPHTTTAGLGLIRVGAACVPLKGRDLARLMTASEGLDLTAMSADGATVKDVDPGAVEEGRRLLRQQPRLRDIAEASAVEILSALGLSDGEKLTRAGLLLFGKAGTIARRLPQHEITLLRFSRGDRYDRREDLRGPLLPALAEIEAFLSGSISVRTVSPHGFAQLEIPSLTWEVAREAVLNAMAHRDYFLRQGVMLAIRRDGVEITSPGGFVGGGVTPENVLRHPPVHRNELLARSLQQLGLVNRVGLGVDRIYEGLLRLGSRPPAYSADEGSVSLTLPVGGSDELAAWIAEHEREHEPLTLDDLIVVRRLIDVGAIDRWAAAQQLQLDEQSVADHLADMRRRGLVVARGRGRGSTYSLPRPISERLRGRGVTDADRPLEAEGVRLRLLELLRERGRLTNAEIRAFSGYSRQQVLALEKELDRDGLIEMRGHGRGAHIVPRT
jgi:ATP-dependent DNA helicase RecG